MKKVFIIILIVLILAVAGGGLFFFLNNMGTQEETQNPAANEEKAAETIAPNGQTMVDCGQAKDPTCFLNRLNGCLPVTVRMTGSDGTTAIEMTILGIENEKCHFQRKIDNVLNLDCFFPKGTLSWDTIDQTFGNDKGLQKVVDDACGKAGW